jgi:hypothetical protein
MIAQQVGSKALRDALFLSHFVPAALPKVMIASALISFAVVSMTSQTLARTGPARIVPITFVMTRLRSLRRLRTEPRH